MTGVRFKPSGSGYRRSRMLRLKTRIPLALSLTRCRLSRLRRPAKKRLPMRRVTGMRLSSPAMREPMTRSAPLRASVHIAGKDSGG